MNIGVDLDGVCYDFAGSLKHYLVTYEGFEDAELNVTNMTWNFFSEQWGMTLEEYLEWYRKGVDAGVVLRWGAPHAGCVETIKDLREEGHKVYIVTYRTVGTRAAQNTVEWLSEFGIEHDALVFSKDKTVVPTDVFIEDNVDNFLALESAGTRAVLMDRPWNRHLETDHRVTCWDEFYLYLSKM